MAIVFNVVIIYAAILVGMRVLGKREFGQLSPLELVTLLLVPELVSQALTRDDYSITNALIGVATLFALVFLTSLVTHRFPRAERVLNSEPMLLVSRGRLIESHMHQERISVAELFGEMHKAGLERLDEVRFAVLEPDGRIAIIPEETRDKAQRDSHENRLAGA